MKLATHSMLANNKSGALEYCFYYWRVGMSQPSCLNGRFISNFTAPSTILCDSKYTLQIFEISKLPYSPW